MTDPISDMLSRIRNAMLVRKPEVVVPHSRFKAELAELLVAAGYLGGVEEIATPQHSLKIRLVYQGSQSAIRSLKRISTPGRRLYAKSTELPRVLSGLGIAVISTSQGLMTNLEARRKHLGGEVVCEVY